MPFTPGDLIIKLYRSVFDNVYLYDLYLSNNNTIEYNKFDNFLCTVPNFNRYDLYTDIFRELKGE